jgi:hypothetical protein
MSGYLEDVEMISLSLKGQSSSFLFPLSLHQPAWGFPFSSPHARVERLTLRRMVLSTLA